MRAAPSQEPLIWPAFCTSTCMAAGSERAMPMTAAVMAEVPPCRYSRPRLVTQTRAWSLRYALSLARRPWRLSAAPRGVCSWRGSAMGARSRRGHVAGFETQDAPAEALHQHPVVARDQHRHPHLVQALEQLHHFE